MTRAQKLAEQRVEQAFYRRCSGIQIRVLDMPKIFKAGLQAVAEGLDDTALGDRVAAIVDTLRVI